MLGHYWITETELCDKDEEKVPCEGGKEVVRRLTILLLLCLERLLSACRYFSVDSCMTRAWQERNRTQ